MRKLRFTIANLLGIILVLGVGFAGLRQSSDLWESGLFTLTLAALLMAILLAVHRAESRRAFWLGFALFGWVYLVLTLVPSIESRLITTKALAYLDSKVPRSNAAGPGYFENDGDWSPDLFIANNSQTNSLFLNKGNGMLDDVTAAAGSNPAGGQEWFSNIFVGTAKGSSGKTENFVRIGHSILALIAAFVGGLISRQLHAKNRQRTTGLPCSETRLEPAGHRSGPIR